MRHRVSHRKLGRVTEHRIAMLRNQAEALLRHERIETTVPKAKELRPFVERIITHRQARPCRRRGERQVAARAALVLRDIQDRDVVSKLFDTIAPRFEGRPGGYTRILRIGYRRGDSAEVAQIELVGSEYDPNAETEKTEAAAKAKPKGVGGRLRAAAERLRGKKAEAGRGRRGRGGREQGQAGAPAQERQGRPRHDEGQGVATARPTQGGRIVSFAASSCQLQRKKAGSHCANRPFLLSWTAGKRRAATAHSQTSSAASCPRSAFAAAMILPCRCAGTSS